MVGEKMKNTYTSMETVKTCCGNTIIFRPDLLAKFYKKTFEENYLSLSQQDMEESFLVDQLYGDLLTKIWKEPLQGIIQEYGADWALQCACRNPVEEYNHQLSLPKDADLTEEEYNLKMERLRLHKEWYETQNS
jgi:hypothetical protein